MKQIEGLIPHYSLLRNNLKSKSGQTLTFYSEFIKGCSIGHLVTSYFYDNFHKYDCLSLDASSHPFPSNDVKDRKAP